MVFSTTEKKLPYISGGQFHVVGWGVTAYQTGRQAGNKQSAQVFSEQIILNLLIFSQNIFRCCCFLTPPTKKYTIPDIQRMVYLHLPMNINHVCR